MRRFLQHVRSQCNPAAVRGPSPLHQSVVRHCSRSTAARCALTPPDGDVAHPTARRRWRRRLYPGPVTGAPVRPPTGSRDSLQGHLLSHDFLGGTPTAPSFCVLKAVLIRSCLPDSEYIRSTDSCKFSYSRDGAVFAAPVIGRRRHL